MDIFWELIGTIGGVGVIIVSIAGFTSKFWADLFMKKKVAEYDKQIELYKNSLELEREKFKALNEQIIYKNKQLFDTEFEIYKIIIPKIIITIDTLVDWVIGSKLDDDIYFKYIEQYKELRKEIAVHSLFIEKEIYIAIDEFCKFAHNKVIDIVVKNSEKYEKYKETDIDDAMEIFNELCDITDDIKKMESDVLDKIRVHLKVKPDFI